MNSITKIDTRTRSQIWADIVTEFSGSWLFIFIFSGIIVVWAAVNFILPLVFRFDPYPFLLMNLFLTIVSTLQSPLILLSQNRQNEMDTLKNEQQRQNVEEILSKLESLKATLDQKPSSTYF